MPNESAVTVSAGGIVLNQQGMVLVVSQGTGATTWSLPKGHIEAGEEPVAAAVREIEEESGLTQVDFVKKLGAYGRYKIGRETAEDKGEWKVLIFFLFKTSQMQLNPKDPRHPLARWVAPDEVEGLLTHPKDKAFYKSILPALQ